jgi:hypothetical protein
VSLQRLMEIDNKFFNDHHQRAMRFAESAWLRSGSPAERRALIALLESIIVHCHEEGLEYPPVFLKRKKQLERGDWTPRARVTSPAPNVSHHPNIPAEWIRQAEELWRKGK